VSLAGKETREGTLDSHTAIVATEGSSLRNNACTVSSKDEQYRN
jgi:hypothetical protein